MRAEFICNLPGEPADSLLECAKDLCPGCVPRIFVDVQPEWTRAEGEAWTNFIGDPYKLPLGQPRPGDKGIYQLLKPGEEEKETF